MNDNDVVARLGEAVDALETVLTELRRVEVLLTIARLDTRRLDMDPMLFQPYEPAEFVASAHKLQARAVQLWADVLHGWRRCSRDMERAEKVGE